MTDYARQYCLHVRLTISSVTSSQLVAAPRPTYLDKLSIFPWPAFAALRTQQTLSLIYSQPKEQRTCVVEYFMAIVRFCHRICTFLQQPGIENYIPALIDADLKAFQSELDRWARSIPRRSRIFVTGPRNGRSNLDNPLRYGTAGRSHGGVLSTLLLILLASAISPVLLLNGGLRQGSTPSTSTVSHSPKIRFPS